MRDNLPSRADVLLVIDRLIEGALTRAEVSEWAFQYIANDDLHIDDDVAWEVIQNLGAADLVSSDRPFLYEIADFRGWRDRLR